MSEIIGKSPSYISIRETVGDADLFTDGFLQYAKDSKWFDEHKPIPLFVLSALLYKSPETIHQNKVQQFLHLTAEDYDPERNFEKAEGLFSKEQIDFRLKVSGKRGSDYEEARKQVVKNLFARLIVKRINKNNLDLVNYTMEELAKKINSKDSPFGLYHIEGASRYVLTKKFLDPNMPIMLAEDEAVLNKMPKKFAGALSKICLLGLLPNKDYKGGLYRLDYLSKLSHSQVNFLFFLAGSKKSTVSIADFDKIFPKMEIKPGTSKTNILFRSRLKDIVRDLADKGVSAEFNFDPKKGVKLVSLEY